MHKDRNCRPLRGNKHRLPALFPLKSCAGPSSSCPLLWGPRVAGGSGKPLDGAEDLGWVSNLTLCSVQSKSTGPRGYPNSLTSWGYLTFENQVGKTSEQSRSFFLDDEGAENPPLSLSRSTQRTVDTVAQLTCNIFPPTSEQHLWALRPWAEVSRGSHQSMVPLRRAGRRQAPALALQAPVLCHSCPLQGTKACRRDGANPAQGRSSGKCGL